ncbi:MAG: tyrosine-type recombinase/integrase [Acidobacteria bacterium]|nr:tyrosine-type recombinase/integrase [Acidobacteriota bacterium]
MNAAILAGSRQHCERFATLLADTSLPPVFTSRCWRLVKDQFTILCGNTKRRQSVIPLNQSARAAFGRMVARAQKLGHDKPEHYIWPACRWHHPDPTRPAKSWDNAWRSLRKAADLSGLRFHDLRHTVITELAEMGVPDHVMESISGHLSRPMLEHYSRVRLDAKRKALEDLDTWRHKMAGQAEPESRQTKRPV